MLSRWQLVIRVALANRYLLAYWLFAINPIMPSVAFIFLFIPEAIMTNGFGEC